MLWYTHRCNLPYVKVQEAEESKFSESAEDRDEADDDEDVQSSCICNLMMIMMMIMKQYYLAGADFKRCCNYEDHLWFSFATESNSDNRQSAGRSKSSPGSSLMTHVCLDQPEGDLMRRR